MKILRLSFSLLIALAGTVSQGVSSSIQHIELYPGGAAVTRDVAIEPSSKDSLLVEISNLPSTLLGSSIQIALVDASELQIGGFSFLPNENPVEEDDQRTAVLRKLVEQLTDKLRLLKLEQASIDQRIAHYNLSAQSIRKSLEEGASTEGYELARMAWVELETVESEGNLRRAELDIENKQLGIALKKAHKDLNEQVADLSRKSGVLRFDLSGDLSNGVKLLVRYQVREAGWNPVHEIRANPAEGTVSWIYKARIYQRTGEDWTDVKVSLNSASALNASGLPSLSPLFLSRMEDHPVKYARSSVAQKEEVFVLSADANAGGFAPESTTTGFFINLPQTLTLETGDEPVVKEAFTGILEADFWSESVPELSTDAWLMAGMTNELGWPILAGESYSYIDGQLVARFHINTMAAGEEIELALGRNEKISIERKERIKKESEGGLIDRTKRHNIKYETTVENRMPVGHRVVLQDRFPIGRDNKIQVRIDSPKDVEPEEGTGIFKWERILESGKKAVLTTEYIITYPAEWTIYPPL